MAFVRIIILLAAALALSGGRSPAPSFKACSHDQGASLLTDVSVLKKAVDHNAQASHDVLPALMPEPAPTLPEPACHPLAELRDGTPTAEYAYSYRYSGLSPPPASV